MTRKICVVTGSRAEYGLLRWVMREIEAEPELTLQLIVTGSHLVEEFGSTYREIETDGFRIDRRVDMVGDADTPVGVTESLGRAVIGFAGALDDLKPDLVLLIGDRYEILGAAAAALIARIPVGHLHGGESSEGAFDEAIRHSISKMSHLHFVAAEAYRNRVVQLGESPDRVFVVGGLGIDGIQRLDLLDPEQLEERLGFALLERNLLVTFHPVTLSAEPSTKQMAAMLEALSVLRDTRIVFTMPNADTEGRLLWEIIQSFVANNPNARAVRSLGQLLYFSCIKHMDGVVGNSSSGLLEVPTFRKGTVNIGERQRGRLRAPSVIDCAGDAASISAALVRLYDPEFQESLASVVSPYGDGGASRKIAEVLRVHDLDGILMKSFYDLPMESFAGTNRGSGKL